MRSQVSSSRQLNPFEIIGMSAQVVAFTPDAFKDFSECLAYYLNLLKIILLIPYSMCLIPVFKLFTPLCHLYSSTLKPPISCL